MFIEERMLLVCPFVDWKVETENFERIFRAVFEDVLSHI